MSPWRCTIVRHPKKMDRILEKLATLEDNDKALGKQTAYLAQLSVGLLLRPASLRAPDILLRFLQSLMLTGCPPL